MGGVPNQVGRRFLYRRRRHHRVPERAGDRRRLHVGGVVPRNFGGCDGLRLRRSDLFDRISGRLAGHHIPDGRATAQPRQIHLRGRGGVPLRADTRAHLRRVGHARRGGLLPDRADGRRGAVDQAAVRARLLDSGGYRRRTDDGLRAVRRHDGDDLGADHQGLPAAWRRDIHGLHGDAPLRFQPGGAVQQPPSRSRPGSRRRRATRRMSRHKKASRSWGRATSSRTRSRRFPSAWR